MDLMELLKAQEPLDDGQRRMMEAAKALFESPEVHAQLHEYDDACQVTSAPTPATSVTIPFVR